MQKRLKLFKESKIVKTYTFIEYKFSANFLYYKAKLELVNNDILYIKEFVTTTEYIYSYHWQNKNEELICRWDNATHHKSIKTHKNKNRDISIIKNDK